MFEVGVLRSWIILLVRVGDEMVGVARWGAWQAFSWAGVGKRDTRAKVLDVESARSRRLRARLGHGPPPVTRDSLAGSPAKADQAVEGCRAESQS
jgi:hypothetical protein